MASKRSRFDWIIGNPPWKGIKSATKSDAEKIVLKWIKRNKTIRPTGHNQAAEAFAWRVRDFAGKEALAGLLVPAMTLFKKDSKEFRKRFFAGNALAYVANFANLHEVLFAGKPKKLGKHSRVPAAAIVFRPNQYVVDESSSVRVPVFSPLVANQEATRPRSSNRRTPTWNFVINTSELRSIAVTDIVRGEGLTWKLAAWGSHLDQRLLHRLSKLRSLGEWADELGLTISEGLQLRGAPKKGGEPVTHHPELEGRRMLFTEALRRGDRMFSFPPTAIGKVTSDLTYVRRGRFDLPESVCRPPHVIVSAARNWAIFEPRYLVVPPRQIGISGARKHSDLLKALAMYLNSDVVLYHEFFTSPERGVWRVRNTLDSLRDTPTPARFDGTDSSLVDEWCQLYDELVTLQHASSSFDDNVFRDATRRLNASVNMHLNLTQSETQRVQDFVSVVLGLEGGKIEPRAAAPPTTGNLRSYATALARELDAFVGSQGGVRHSVQLWHNDDQGVVQVGVNARDAGPVVHPRREGIRVVSRVKALRDQLESRFSQWRYFNRNLTMFVEDRVYLFKPMQRFQWLKSQAVLDASEVIALVMEHIGVNGEQR